MGHHKPVVERSYCVACSAVDVRIITVVGKVGALFDRRDRGGQSDCDFAATHVCGNVKGHCVTMDSLPHRCPCVFPVVIWYDPRISYWLVTPFVKNT